MPLGYLDFKNWVTTAQENGQLDQTLTLQTTSKGEVKLEAGGLKTINLAFTDSRMAKVKEIELTPEEKEGNVKVRQAFYKALCDEGTKVTAEIQEFLLGEGNKCDALTGKDLQLVFRSLKNRTIDDARTGMVAANDLAKAGLEDELLKELDRAGYSENTELDEDEARLSPLDDALSEIITALTNAKRPESLKVLFDKGSLMKAFRDIHDMQSDESNNPYFGVEHAERKLRKHIKTFSDAAYQLGEAINSLSDKVEDRVRDALFILQEKTELYAIRLENVVEELKADSKTASSGKALFKALRGEFGASGLGAEDELKLEDELADVNHCISELYEIADGKPSESKQVGLGDGDWTEKVKLPDFLARARRKVDALAEHLQTLSNAEDRVFDSVRTREILRQVVAVKSSLDKYGANINTVKDKFFLFDDGKERRFGSPAALREAFCGHLDVAAYIKLGETYPEEMIEFFVGDDNVASTRVFGGSVYNDGAVFGHRIASGKGPARFVSKNLHSANESVEKAPYRAAGITSSQDMARTNYACFKAGQVILGTQSNVKSKVSVVGSGKDKGKFSILMEQAKGKSVYDLNEQLREDKAERRKHFGKGNRNVYHWRGIGSLLKSANELDWTDWLTAQGDRHFGNVMVDVDDMNTFTFKGIDNDLSMPTCRPSLDRFVLPNKTKADYDAFINKLKRYFNAAKDRLSKPAKAKFQDVTFDQLFQKDVDTGAYKLLPFDETKGECVIDLSCFEADGNKDKEDVRIRREITMSILGMNNLRRPHYITSGQLAKLEGRAAELDKWDEINAKPVEDRQQALKEFATENPQSIYAQFKDILRDEGQIAGLYSRTRDMLEHARKLEKDGFVLDESLLTEENLAKAANGTDSRLSKFYTRLKDRMFADMKAMSSIKNPDSDRLPFVWNDVDCHIDTAMSMLVYCE